MPRKRNKAKVSKKIALKSKTIENSRKKLTVANLIKAKIYVSSCNSHVPDNTAEAVTSNDQNIYLRLDMIDTPYYGYKKRGKSILF